MVDKNIIKELSAHEKKVLLTLDKLKGNASPQQITEIGKFTQEVEVINAASWLQSKHLVIIHDHIHKLYSLGKDGKRFIEKGLPEKRALSQLLEKKGTCTIRELGKNLEGYEIPIAIGWLKKNNWATVTKDKETVLTLTDKGKQAINQQTPEEEVLRLLSMKEEVKLSQDQVNILLSRKNVVKEKERITSTIELTEKGKQLIQQGIEITEEISQLTSSLIKDGKWKNKTIRPYDIETFAPSLFGGKPHPLVELIKEIRQIFVEMGFQEIDGDYVDSTFWCMDVLFIPQDHPAREMQDTFYCQQPAKRPIKDTQLLQTVAAIHENGGKTQSKGWGYSFSEEESKRVLLRTHTTINTIQYLYTHPQPPCKVFSIGRVFRKERIDSTHLPEFYQIEGIIHEKGATFRQLIGDLKEFYKRMGFEKIRCRPGYFPYTEPSLEIDVMWKGKWMELGGSGIFRPEVTQAVGVKHPVLAWGLGLERLAMLRFGLSDMRDLYISDLEWLHNSPMYNQRNK